MTGPAARRSSSPGDFRDGLDVVVLIGMSAPYTTSVGRLPARLRYALAHVDPARYRAAARPEARGDRSRRAARGPARATADDAGPLRLSGGALVRHAEHPVRDRRGRHVGVDGRNVRALLRRPGAGRADALRV